MAIMRKRRPNCPQSTSLGAQLRQWYELPLGQSLRACERERLEEILPNLFGYHLLQVGALADGVLSASRVLHRAVMAVADEPRADHQGGLCGDPARLPICGDSLDALVLYHTLDFAPDPHQVLREAERVLVAEGSIVVLGFNPWSLWGVWHGLARRRGVPWCGRFVSLARLRDWLSLLGFEILSTGQLFRRPPLQRAALLERLAFMEGAPGLPGGVYVMVARKKVLTMTPVKPRWRPRRSLVSGFADTASRNAARVRSDVAERG